MANTQKPDGKKIKTSGVGLPENVWQDVDQEAERQGYPSRNAYMRDAVEAALRMNNLRVQVAQWQTKGGPE